MEGWLKPQPFSCLGAGCLGCNFIAQLIMWVMLGCFVGLIVLMFLGGMDAPTPRIVSLLAGGAAVGGIAFIIYQTVHHLRDREPPRQLDMSAVEVLHCTATEAVYVECPIEYDEDMMPAYALQVEEKTILFLNEYEAEEGCFPCREFRVVISRDEQVLRVECLGEPLPISRTYLVQQEPERIPQSFDLVNGTLDMLPAILRKYGA
jgi:hypothetical protein